MADLVCILGAGLVVAGVAVLAGLGPALVAGGVALLAGGVLLARGES